MQLRTTHHSLRSLARLPIPAALLREFDPHPWILPPLHRTVRPTRRRVEPMLLYPTYSVFATGAVSTGNDDLTPAVPAGTLTGKLMLLFCSSANATDDAVQSTPAGWTLFKAGINNTCMLYGRIGTASESAPTINWLYNFNAKIAWITALTCSAGWPAIGSVLADSMAGNNVSVTGQRYGALTITQEGCCGAAFGAKNIDDGGSNPATAVAVTSGWTACGAGFRNTAGEGIAGSGQIMNTLPTIAGGIPENNETITGNSTSAFQRRITVTLKGVQATSFALDASSRVETPYSGLPLFLLDAMVANGNTGAFQAGDTYEEDASKARIPAGAQVTVAAFGVVTIAFDNPNPVPVTVFFRFKDANGSGDGIYNYGLTFYPPDSLGPVVTNAGVVSVTDTTATVNANLTDDRPPISMYVVSLEPGANPPSDAQIIAGTDSLNQPAQNATTVINDSGVASVTITGLLTNHNYEFHGLGVDSMGNKSTHFIVTGKTAGVTYPSAATIQRTTVITPIINVQIDLMDDGTLRASDVTAIRAFDVEIHHQWLTLAQRDTVNTFVEANLYRKIDIAGADGNTYRCLLTNGPTWEEASGTRVHGTLRLKGNRA